METKLLILTSLLESALLMPGPVGKSLGRKVTLDLLRWEGKAGPAVSELTGAQGGAWRGLEQLASLVSMRAGHDAG